MGIIISILKFLVGAANFTTNIVTLKKYIIAVMVNTLIGLLLATIAFYYPFGGWIGLAINLFFLYAGGAYVATWNKAFGAVNLFTAEDFNQKEEDKNATTMETEAREN